MKTSLIGKVYYSENSDLTVMSSYVIISSVYEIDDLSPCASAVLKHLIDTPEKNSLREITDNVSCCKKRAVQYALKDLVSRDVIVKTHSYKDMRVSKYNLKATIIKNRSYGLIEIKLI